MRRHTSATSPSVRPSVRPSTFYATSASSPSVQSSCKARDRFVETKHSRWGNTRNKQEFEVPFDDENADWFKEIKKKEERKTTFRGEGRKKKKKKKSYESLENFRAFPLEDAKVRYGEVQKGGKTTFEKREEKGNGGCWLSLSFFLSSFSFLWFFAAEEMGNFDLEKYPLRSLLVL